MNTLKIQTTEQELYDAYLLMNKGRGKQVSVRRDQFVHMALDHTTMVRALEKLGVKIEVS